MGRERRSFGLGRSGVRSCAGEQGYVNVLEDLPRGDAQNTVGGFDEVIALAAGVLTAESVGEGEAGGELFGFDQKASAIRDPWSGCFHVFRPACLTVKLKW